MRFLERVVERKASTGPFFFCVEGPTLADLAVYDFLESPFPGLKALGVELAAYLKLKSMGKPELIYFDLAGRGELTRLAFIAGGVDFTDTRHSFDAWPALKGDPESVPAKMFGSMPCIKHGDVMLAQSKATAVYAASLGIWKEGRLGETMEESSANKATELMVLGAYADVGAAMLKCLFGDDESKAKGKAALPAAADGVLAGLERMLERKSCDGAYFFSTKGPTLSDLAVYDMVTSPFPGLQALEYDYKKFQKLSAIVDAVAEDPKIKAFKSKA